MRNVSFRNFLEYYRTYHEFVPVHQKANAFDVSLLQNFINENKNIVALTGAGISTESGLPDYRSEGVGLYDRSPNRPVQYRDFISNFQTRKRYWARNFAAWDKFSSSLPNETHFCLTSWEKKGILNCLVTQNVDRLHHKAGSERVIELHGTSYMIKCLKCNYSFSRFLLQQRFLEVNPNFPIPAGEVRPDADVDLNPSQLENFNVVNCEKCDGILKPDVVFFGETVPKDIVFNIYKKIQESDAILVLGSSLAVYSGYRFVLYASELKKPIGIVNIGHTRADSLATFKLNTRCGDLLPKVFI